MQGKWQCLGGDVVGECVDKQTALIVGCLWFCGFVAWENVMGLGKFREGSDPAQRFTGI